MRVSFNKVFATIALFILLLGGAVWNYMNHMEDQASAAIDQLLHTINQEGAVAAAGLLGSEPSYAKDHWWKSSGLIDDSFIMNRFVFSHKTKALATTGLETSVFLIHGRSGLNNITIEAMIDGSKTIHWTLRSTDDLSISNEAIASGCTPTYAIVQGYRPPIENVQPPWVVFPNTSRFSPKWYQENKHEYILNLGQPWALLGQYGREKVIKTFAEPDAWRGWYEDLGARWTVDRLCQGDGDESYARESPQ